MCLGFRGESHTPPPTRKAFTISCALGTAKYEYDWQ
jgi:hypothetical protein